MQMNILQDSSKTVCFFPVFQNTLCVSYSFPYFLIYQIHSSSEYGGLHNVANLPGIKSFKNVVYLSSIITYDRTPSNGVIVLATPWWNSLSVFVHFTCCKKHQE